ncbi:MAG: iron-sulfur cluster-binding domain-containing protein [Chitinophagaceae bacterium]
MAEQFSLKVTGIREETAHSKTFFLKPVNGKNVPYQAGQFLSFIFHQYGRELRRSYSLSSSPNADDELSITVKLQPNGAVSRWMLHEISNGYLLHALPPSGMFTIQPQTFISRDIFLIGAGSGIVPLYSILKTLLIAEPQSRVVLIYSNHSQQEAIFYGALTALQQRYPQQLHIEFLFSNYQDILKARLSVVSLQALLQQHLHHQKGDALIYTCGPYYFMQMVQIVALTNGFAKEHIRKEIFTIGTEAEASKQYYDHTDRSILLQYQGITHALFVPFNKSILTAALDAGIDLPYSCRGGRCSTCKGRVLQGNVWMHYNEVLTNDDEAKGLVLTCTGHPISNDVVIQVN